MDVRGTVNPFLVTRHVGSIPSTPTKDINAIKFTLYQAVSVGSTPTVSPL